MKIAQLIVTVTFGLALPLSLMGQERARLDTTVRLNLRGTVDLSLVSGKITVRGWELADVKVVASTENGALRFDATSNRVTLRVEQERDQSVASEMRGCYCYCQQRLSDGSHLPHPLLILDS